MVWPDAEIVIDEPLVVRLIADQFPELRGRTVTAIGEGFDNAIWRIGVDVVARLPRRLQGVVPIQNELQWLPVLLANATLETTLPLREGRPSAEFPWPWLVCRWIDGTPGIELDSASRSNGALTLAAFLRTLHREAPLDAPFNPYRSVSLETLEEVVKKRIAELNHIIDVTAMSSLWRQLRRNVAGEIPRSWLHGDLHAGNMIFVNRELRAVIDFGDLCAGDPATDLAGAFLTFEQQDVRVFLEKYGAVDEQLLLRTMCWTLHFSLNLLLIGQSHPPYGRLGELGIANVRAFLSQLRPGPT